MELSTTILFIVVIVIDWLTSPVFWLIGKISKRKVPPVENDLLKMSATKLSEMIRKKRVTCETVVKAYIRRIRQVNYIINAIVEDRFEYALEDAISVDKFLSETTMTEEELRRKRPLLGVPLTVKESCSLKGLSGSVGSLKFHGRKSDRDGEAVAKLKAAGAIPLLVSNTPELCFGWETSNHITGITRNPYNTAHAAGGSSGGEGALLGAGASVIGIGSDIAGSIRVPSLFNGIFGLKPTPRTIPIVGHMPYSDDKIFPNYLTVGPMVRYAEDLPLMVSVICENPELLKLEEKVDLSTLRIYSLKSVGESWLSPSTDEDIRNVIDLSVDHFQQVHQSKVCSKKLEGLENMVEMALSLIIDASEDVPKLLTRQDSNTEELNPWLEVLKTLFLMSSLTFSSCITDLVRKKRFFIQKAKREEFVKIVAKIKEEFTKELGTDGVLFIPSFSSSAFYNGQSLLKLRETVYLESFNVLGLPALQTPLGLDRKGLPIGFQVVAGPYQDRLCMAVAKELEKRFGGWVPPSP